MSKFIRLLLIGSLIATSSMLAVTVVSAASASIQLMKPVSCWPSSEVFTAIRNTYEETILWTATNGQDTVTQLALTVNPQTRTWTLVEFTAEQACVLGSGRGYIAPREPVSDGIKL